jgi:hypothetical protein
MHQSDVYESSQEVAMMTTDDNPYIVSRAVPACWEAITLPICGGSESVVLSVYRTASIA